jgi:hypothetical protein
VVAINQTSPIIHLLFLGEQSLEVVLDNDMLLVTHWKLYESKRGDAYTYFASLPEVDDSDPNYVTIARFHNPANGTGTNITETKSFSSLWKACGLQWEDMVEAVSMPVLNCNEAKQILLKGNKPAFMDPYDKISMEPPEGHSLYKLTWKAHSQAHKNKLVEYWLQMTEEEDKADTGDCFFLCRYIEDLTTCSGFSILCAPDDTANMSIHTFLARWGALCECRVEPVLTDAQIRKIVLDSPGYEQKLESLKMKMGMK